MKIPFLRPLNTKTKRKVFNFKGINRLENSEEGELTGALNLSSSLFPTITPRKSREVVNTLVNGEGLISSEGKLVYIDDGTLYYDGVAITGLSLLAGEHTMVDFNGNIVISTKGDVLRYYDYVNNSYGVVTDSPKFDYITSYYNRIVGVIDDEIKASKLGDFKIYNEFTGVETDSWASDVYSEGRFIGLKGFQNHLVLFKDDFIYEMYGATPSQFSIQEVGKIGCIDNRSIVEVNNTLFFLGKKGIYAYQGGVPRLISQKLDETYISGAAIGDERKYYISLETNEGYKLYVFDTFNGAWIKEDELEVKHFTEIDKTIYALTSDNEIVKFNVGSEVISWSFETKAYDEQSFNKKTNLKIKIRMELEANTTVNIYTKTDNNNYTLEKTITEDVTKEGKKDYTVVLKPRRAERMKIKISGVGQAKISGIERLISIRSDS